MRWKEGGIPSEEKGKNEITIGQWSSNLRKMVKMDAKDPEKIQGVPHE